MKLTALLKNKTAVRTAIVCVSFLILFFLGDLFVQPNLFVEKIFSKVKGETSPDTNIVLIHFSESDLESIGPWPIKRSYYALLINKLTGCEVKAIGLEVFLSAKFISQTIYDNLLTNEIMKSGRVVLSSVSGNIEHVDNRFFTDSLSYPSPKLLEDTIQTGHINYLEDPTIKIPLELKANREIEEAFSYKLFHHSGSANKLNMVDVNFISSWRFFQSYSLLEFFDLVKNDDPKLSGLKNKIVIIGVSDRQVAQSITTAFDDSAPPFTLHAFAFDNMMHNRYYRDEYKLISTIVFSVIFLFIVWLLSKRQIRDNLILLFTFVILFIFSFVLHSYFYLRLDYWAIILPSVLLLIHQFVFELTEKKSELNLAVDETRILKSLLSNRQNELQSLRKELEFAAKEKSSTLVEKIKVLEGEISRLKESASDTEECDIAVPNEVKNFRGIIYKSKVIQNIIDVIRKTAPADATVLITGESGTGKELVARAIHSLSMRNQNNFVAVNCGAISETLLESELFGHIKGSFTGAMADKIGRFEAADNGTIFLDEVAETSENFQVKLLRVLQSGEFEKVGSSKTSKVNIRVIAATNKKLEQSVREKKFREDLFYRLNVIRIDLPPLRERKEDVKPLAVHFINAESPEYKISKAVMDALENYKWSGNIRELEAVIKRAVIFAKSSGRKMIQLNDLPDEIVKGLKLNFEELVLDSLRQKKFSHSSIVETAKELGDVNRTTISENFRGIVFKVLAENNFNFDKTLTEIAGTDDLEVIDRVRTKMQTFLGNIKESVNSFSGNDFDSVRANLSSKYKNLPQKFHIYLDSVVKHYLR